MHADIEAQRGDVCRARLGDLGDEALCQVAGDPGEGLALGIDQVCRQGLAMRGQKAHPHARTGAGGTDVRRHEIDEDATVVALLAHGHRERGATRVDPAPRLQAAGLRNDVGAGEYPADQLVERVHVVDGQTDAAEG